MATSSDPQGLIHPLNVGNVVSAGLRLYRDHFKQYSGLALMATLWSLVPFLGLIAFGLFAALIVHISPKIWAILLLLIPAWFVLALYCSAKVFARSAAIGRLVFGELTQQPEAASQASRYTRSRMWSFLLLNVVLGLLFVGIFLVGYFLLAIVIGISIAVLGGSALQSSSPETFISALMSNPASAIATILIILALILLFLGFLLWLGSRFAVASLPLAVESGVDGPQSIGRSWSLTSKSAWRIALILFVAGLITTPLYILSWLIGGVFDGVLSVIASPDSPSYTALSFGISYILGLVVNILVLPLWQAIRAVIYYDLRSRREGLGLQLRDRSL